MTKNGQALAGIPFVVGVTGHRDLRPGDLEQIKSVLRGLFTDVQSLLPHTPLRVLSPLAEGADRVVADVALELGIELVAVLPFAVEEFEKDFESPESIAEFRRLLDGASTAVTIPDSRNDERNCQESDDPRAIQYALTGAFVAEHSQFLIALWDGEDTGKLGGTWQVVDFVRNGIPISFRTHGDLLSQEELGDVAHIRVNRANSEHEDAAIAVEMMMDDAGEPKSMERAPTLELAMRNLNVFNRLAATMRTENRTFNRSNSREEAAESEVADVRKRFDTADGLAVRMQRIYVRAWATILLLSFAAAITLQIHLNAVSGWLLAVSYGLIVVIAFGVYCAIRLLRVEERYLDYRALAEGLRVQMHWLVAGMHVPVSQHYLHRQHSELRWIRIAIRNATFKATYSHTVVNNMASFEARVAAIRTNWIQDQFDYFNRTVQKTSRADRCWTWAARIMLAVGVILAVVKSVFGHSPWLIVLVAAPPILVAIFTLHLQNRQFGPLAQQASRMASLFECALGRLHEFQSTTTLMDHEFERLLKQLGREVLAENAEWVTLHRDRPISTPFVA